MKVNTILQSIHLPKVSINHTVSSIESDSRNCKKDSIFVAIDSQYIEDAIAHGAKTIVTSQKVETKENINYCFVDHPRKYVARLANVYYKKVLKHLTFIGVIGTNGKTTTSSIGYYFWNWLGKRSMLIGTNGVFCNQYEARLNNTTPDILTLYKYLILAKQKNIHTIFMEVSSVSVDQFRVYGIPFKALIFTNFSQDHLDYHKSMEAYFFCKTIPFIKLSKKAYAILNADDVHSKDLSKYTDAHCITYGYKQSADILGTLNTATEEGISFYTENTLFKTRLIGEFNIYNCLAIVSLCKIFSIPYSYFQQFLSQFEPVSGRMNLIHFKKKYVLLDYAHTLVATENAITEGRRLCKGKMIVLLGCGGNREKEKRFMIGKYLNTIPADIILTTDNPRFEDPMDIIHDIKSAMTKEVTILPNRIEAIKEGLSRLNQQDYLLVLGKGCETYMEIQGIKHPYSDLEVIHDWIRKH